MRRKVQKSILNPYLQAIAVGILALMQHNVINMTVDGEFIVFLIQY